ncbi:response regulator transcription factor [Dongia sedimenti]|uniref:Response regulator n=1 Tax=Dongia sedimenti TaxID=3064282 RepID=A0ABU0YUU1_9PROT|nr:response regulator [Rhodospirillaceae bacterium R-7]
MGRILASDPHIAIIDDDASVRAAIGSLVRSLGYIAQSYASAELFLLSGDLPQTDCIVTDVQMPSGMSGLDLQDRLTAAGVKVPTVIITAFPEEHVRNRARAGGAIGFLAKPFDGRTLVKLLVDAVEH